MIAFRMDWGGALIVAAILLMGIGAIPASLAAGLLLGLLTVASLLLHECGHIVAARLLGVNVREIGLCLKGSYIRRERSRALLDDAAISLSGPVVNGLIAAAAWTIPGVGHQLAIYNLVLLAANLAPLPGCDGRRIYNAWTQAFQTARVPARTRQK